VVKFRIINGKKVPLPGSDYVEPPDPKKPSKETSSSPFDDDYNRRRQEDFKRIRIEEFKNKKQTKAQKKQATFDRVINLNLGHAKGFLIKATPVLVQLDPTLSSVYTSYKVGKYGYCFLKQVDEDYQKSGNYEESLKNVAKQEIEKKITSKIKSDVLQNGSQYAANMVWSFCKETYFEGKMNPKWDNFGKSALAKTFEDMGRELL